MPFPPDDPDRGETFADRVKALLRRHVVERCIYGVDINPLAVELARVSLWVETLDPELPFSFLDHKIKVGNSLVGCWLDRVEDYPLKAWEREGGDGKDGPRTQRIEEFLKGEKIGNRVRAMAGSSGRCGRSSRAGSQGYQTVPRRAGPPPIRSLPRLRDEYEKLHELPIGDPDERERFYREHRGERARSAAEAGDGRVVCRLVLADRRGVACARPHAAEFPRRTVASRHWPSSSQLGSGPRSSSTGNWNSPMCSRPSGAGSTP